MTTMTTMTTMMIRPGPARTRRRARDDAMRCATRVSSSAPSASCSFSSSRSRSRSRSRASRRASLADDARAQSAALDGVDPRWIAGMVRFWLDEEWERGATVNARVGDAVAASFAARVDAMDAREEEPLQRLVFGLAEDLLAFDFSDTFVSAFEVSNKVIEMLMLRAGIDVCCVGEEDVTRADRYEASLRASTE
jgi:hypothetical protein|tara:strand:+ start:1577 stop:2158 length:582 start_codon:yes stop_codon:yes gene_type:complete